MWSMFSNTDWGISDTEDDVRAPEGYDCEGPGILAIPRGDGNAGTDERHCISARAKCGWQTFTARVAFKSFYDQSFLQTTAAPIFPSPLFLQVHCVFLVVTERWIIWEESHSNNSRPAFTCSLELLRCHCPKRCFFDAEFHSNLRFLWCFASYWVK